MHRIRRFRPGVAQLENRKLLSIGHGGSVPLQSEHDAAFALVSYDKVTDTAARDGAWSDPQTWAAGRAPLSGARVLIPEGIDVLLDRVVAERLNTVRVDGSLTFAVDTNTRLSVDTLMVNPGAHLTIGSDAAPIRSGVSAEVVFTDTGAIDRVADPYMLGRGLISHGIVDMRGESVTPFVGFASAKAGATVLTLDSAPVGWRPGDKLVITGTNLIPSRNEDEVVAIASVAGNAVTLAAPLKFNHTPPRGEFRVYAANESRNVRLRSENAADPTRAGHVMFMHATTVKVINVGFYGLGRTDKSKPLDDPKLDASGRLVPGTGTNPRARYAVHFHRAGDDGLSGAATVSGSVVVGSPGWGFVNHSSNVNMTNNVAYDAFGAGFATETGSEIGSMVGNLAIRSLGSGQGIQDRFGVQDFGHDGVGFWFQGPGLTVEDNVAVGNRKGFVVFAAGLNEAGLGQRQFYASNLRPEDAVLAKGQTTLPIGSVPIREFSDNTSFASLIPLETWSIESVPGHESRFVGFRSWNTWSGVLAMFGRNHVYKDLYVLGNPSAPSLETRGFMPNAGYSTNMHLVNPRLEGWGLGMTLVEGSSVSGGLLNNVTNVEVITVGIAALGADSRIDADVAFGPLDAAWSRMWGIKQVDFRLQGVVGLPTAAPYDLSTYFSMDRAHSIGKVTYGDKQFYLPNQDPDYVPFPTAAPHFPAALIGLTHRQILERYNIAPGNYLAPTGPGTPDPKIVGGFLAAPSAPVGPFIRVASNGGATTNKLANHSFVYQNMNDGTYATVTIPALEPGWNLVSRTIGGVKRTFAVLSDSTPAGYFLDPSTPPVIRTADLKEGFVLNITITGQYYRPIPGIARIGDLDQLPVEIINGKRVVTMRFTVYDPTGTVSVVAVPLTIDDAAPPQPTAWYYRYSKTFSMYRSVSGQHSAG